MPTGLKTAQRMRWRSPNDPARHSTIRVAERYSGDELDAALKAAPRAIEYCLKEAGAGVNAGRTLIETLDAAPIYRAR
jgi:hypothetical protein